MTERIDSPGMEDSEFNHDSLLEKVIPLAQQLNSLDMDQIAKICVKDLPELIGVRLASLYILDDANNILHLQSNNHSFLINKIVSLNQNPPTPMIMALRSKKLILVRDIDTHQSPVIKKSQRAYIDNYKTNNCIIAPLVCQDRVVGILNLSDKSGSDDFSCDDIALVELFSNLAGASLGNIKLFEKIQKQATTDGLTGLANHRTFYESLERELWRSRRYGGQISMIMIDVDNLKKINDVHGHRAGDKAIREVSRRIKQCIRQIDIAARYGGDEFAIILPNTLLEDAIHVGERMIEMVSSTPVPWENKTIELSISVGVGQYDSEASPEDITSSSDEALYLAKQAGKNRMKVFESAKRNEK